MNLKKYLKKRDFFKTPEPKGEKKIIKNLPVFCIQKHQASHLHYDFRLEHKGILLSWAIPKGPSLSTEDKRLAIQVEDHPFDYRNFEGVIPKGNYGAGSVIVWDEGSYFAGGFNTKKEIEKYIDAGLKKGHLDLNLFGKKLKGSFSLILLRKEEDKNLWLLMKKHDEYANKKVAKKKWDISVKSGKTIEEMTEKIDLKKESDRKFPNFIKPMLATLIEAPFDDVDWIFEIKWDGYRCLAYLNKEVELLSRNKKKFNETFSSIVKDLKKLKAKAILDGEVVVLDKNGKSDFQLMQNYQKTKTGDLFYYVFDILYLNGKDLRELPLLERKEILRNLLQTVDLKYVRYNDHIEKNGVSFFKEAKKLGLEGIIGKNILSPYVSIRTRNWVKIKTQNRQEAIIAGFTEPKGHREKFGSLLLGVSDEKENLKYIGLVGTGFNKKLLEDLYEKMRPLIQKKSPFLKAIERKDVTWLKPKLVCEISFTEWTREGVMRHPSFEGLRMDKSVKEVKKELKEPIEKEEKKQRDSSISLTNLDKVYWPKDGYTKGDLLEYYQEITSYILPYLKNRPVFLRRYPNGIEGDNFFQKETKLLNLPKEIKTVSIAHEEKEIKYFVIDNRIALEYVANLGTIELHPFHSHIGKLNYPDYFVLDLDPESVSFNRVIKTAKIIHDFLEELKIPNYCKTSGGRGLHLYIPLQSKYNIDQVVKFGEALAFLIHKELPKITSIERSPINRQKKIYLDVLQNRSKQAVVAPYSVRGRPHAPVSTPIHWNELETGLKPEDFNIKSIPQRLKKVGDIFVPILGTGFNIKKWIDGHLS